MKKKALNTIYACLCQLVCIPLLAYISMLIYTKFLNGNIAPASQAIGLLAIILANIGSLYGFVYFFKEVLKMPLIYYLITGTISIFVLLWINVYTFTLEKYNCENITSLKCIDTIHNNKIASTIFIACIVYFILYIFIHKIAEKKRK